MNQHKIILLTVIFIHLLLISAAATTALTTEKIGSTKVKYVSSLQNGAVNKTKAREALSFFNESVFDGIDVLVFSSKEPKINHKVWREGDIRVETYESQFGHLQIFRRFTRMTIYRVNTDNVDEITSSLYFELINWYHASGRTNGIAGYNSDFPRKDYLYAEKF